MVIKIYFDGASSNNGKENQNAGIGVVVYKEKETGLFKKVYEFSQPIGNGTNNQAEWLGLIEALKLVLKTQHKYSKFEILGDSKLVVEQFNGNWKVKDNSLKELYKEAKEIASKITVDFKVCWIPREKNPADKLAKKGKGKEN